MIPVNEPLISSNASKYVQDCLDSRWVSSAGEYINRFEKNFAKFIGTKYAVTTTSGTSALHLALASMGIGPGDEVIIPNLTIISCALAAIYLGAKPVMVDVEYPSGNIDPSKIEEKITKRTKAIMVVHLYGRPAKLEAILKVSKKYKIPIIEDAAQAHGAMIKIDGVWKKAGSIGEVSCFSFYGNKIVTTGEGGMVLTNSREIYEKACLLKDLAHVPGIRFLHREIGYNFRMTNLQAALGLAQLEEVNKYVKKKRWMANKYRQKLQNYNFLELPTEDSSVKSVFWMYAVLIKPGSKFKRDEFCKNLKEKGVDTRNYFIPLNVQPALQVYVNPREKYPVSEDLSQRGFYLPSGLAIAENQIYQVVAAIREVSKN